MSTLETSISWSCDAPTATATTTAILQPESLHSVEKLDTRALKESLDLPRRWEDIYNTHMGERISKTVWDRVSSYQGHMHNIWSQLYEFGLPKYIESQVRTTAYSTSTSKLCGSTFYRNSLRPLMMKMGAIRNASADSIDSNITVAKDNKKTDKKTSHNKKSSNRKQELIQRNNLVHIKQELLTFMNSLKFEDHIAFTERTLDSIISRLNATGGKKRRQPEIEYVLDLLETVRLDFDKDNKIEYSYKFLEFVLCKLMLLGKQLTHEYVHEKERLHATENNKYATQEDKQQIIDVMQQYRVYIMEYIIGFEKYVREKSNNLTSESEIASCLGDANDWVSFAKEVIAYDVLQVSTQVPQYLFRTRYDTMLENSSIQLYPSQRDILNYVHANQNGKYLILVHTMLSSGKTSMVLPLCKYLTETRDTNGAKFLITCPNEIVLEEIATMMNSAGAPYAIVKRLAKDRINEKINMQGTYSRKLEEDFRKRGLDFKWCAQINRTNDPHRNVIAYLCNAPAAKIMLEHRESVLLANQRYRQANKRDPINYPLTNDRLQHVPKYLFLGDELTKDADSQEGFMTDSGFSLTTELFVRIMALAPDQIILMSATLPTYEQMPEFYDAIVARHPGMQIKSYASREAKIGCGIIDHSGKIYTPHSSCKTPEDIKRVLDVIATNPFIGRFYTFEILLEMCKRFEKYNLSPDLRKEFDNINYISQVKIQQITSSMLEQLIHQPPNIISELCDYVSDVTRGIKLDEILTSDINRFHQGCLIFSSDPISTALETYQNNFRKYLNLDDCETIFDRVKFAAIMQKYEDSVDKWQQDGERLANRKEKISDIKQHNKEHDKKERIAVEKWQTVSNKTEQKPSWDFPALLQLQSPEFVRMISAHSHGNYQCGSVVNADDIPLNDITPNNILMMLASGIGIYTKRSTLLSQAYLDTVITLAKKGSVKFIFTDDSIAYGTNLAVSDIIVCDQPTLDTTGQIISSIVDRHSMKTIFQMLGRAGRGGILSYKATVYTISPDNRLIQMIDEYIHGTLNEGTRDEIANIRRAAHVLWQ